MEMTEFEVRARSVVRDAGLGFDQKLRRLAAIGADSAVRHTGDHLAAGSENASHLTQRAMNRIDCHERDPR
jgi:hypothetical protein